MLFARYSSKKYGKKLLDTAAKAGLNTLKTDSKNAVHKIAETTGEFIGNKIAEKTVKPKHVLKANSRNVE